MKKLVLKKEIVARINHGEMNQLRGGYEQPTDALCSNLDCKPKPTVVVTCPGKETCTGANTCQLSCGGTCQTCPWNYSCQEGCTGGYGF